MTGFLELVLSEARLEALGADLKGVTEKTELVNLLEQPLGCIMPA